VRINVRTCELPEGFAKTTFWEFLRSFRELINRCKDVDGPVRSAAGELVRFTWATTGDLEDLFCFVRAYGKLRNQLHKKVMHLSVDLSDSFPLLGEPACLRVLHHGVKSVEELNEIIEVSCQDFPFLATILKKQNMVEQALEDALASRICDFLIENDADFLLELENADP
jgi:hypothetical protein